MLVEAIDHVFLVWINLLLVF